MGKSRSRRYGLASLGCVFAAGLAATGANGQCVGDCDGSGAVSINELVTGVAIALGTDPVSTCEAFDCQATGMVPIGCLVQGVRNALEGCTSPTPTPTAGGPCAFAAGKYTLTQRAGGRLTLATLSPFPFPTGGTLVLDVSAATRPDCLHSVVVPFPAGFDSPAFCIPGTGYSVRMFQTGCGIGQIDSNGGSDYTVTELGDTSYASPTCDVRQASCPVGGPAPDSSISVKVTVGDGIPDTCSDGGTANAIVAIPVHTVIWIEQGTGTCPAADGTFDPDQGDEFILDVPEILDFTTDAGSAKFQDLDGDGCSKSGAGRTGAVSSSGTCLDLSKLNRSTNVCRLGAAACSSDADCATNGPCEVGECQLDASTGCDTDTDCIVTSGNGLSFDLGPCKQPVGIPAVTIAASGTVGSGNLPLYDLSFTTQLVHSISGPEPPLGATCNAPPLIDFRGTVDRCIK